MPMDREERDLLESFERDEWRAVDDREAEMARFVGVADQADRKEMRVNIRLSRRDLLRIKAIALREGIPYQTLISSVLHKFGNGDLTDDRS